jgi:hypothetical protein
MVDSVTIPARITGTTDHTYTNDDNPSTGLAGGMHTVNLVPMFADSVKVALYCEAQIALIDNDISASLAEIDAHGTAALDALENHSSTAIATMDARVATVAQSPSTNATSVTSMSASIASKSFTLVETGKAYSLGQTVNIANTGVNAVMSGIITAYNSTTGAMTVNVSTLLGTGTFSNWIISVGAMGGGVSNALATTSSPVVISSSAPPTAKQLLVATSPTTAEWQDPPKSTPDFLLINAGII